MSWRAAPAVTRRVAATPLGRASVSAPPSKSVRNVTLALIICATTIVSVAFSNQPTTPEPLPYRPTPTTQENPGS